MAIRSLLTDYWNTDCHDQSADWFRNDVEIDRGEVIDVGAAIGRPLPQDIIADTDELAPTNYAGEWNTFPRKV